MNALIAKSMGALTLTVTLIGASAYAVAGSADSQAREEPSVNVRFADLDLSKPADAAILYQRIQRAARLVCNSSAAAWDGRATSNWQRCYNGAVEDVVLHINRPMVTAVHRRLTQAVSG